MLTDKVDVYYEPQSSAAAAALAELVDSHAGYLRESIGVNVLPASARPLSAVIIASERTTIGGGTGGSTTAATGEDGQASVATALPFTAILATPAVTPVASALLAACDGSEELADAVRVVLASRDLAKLQAEAAEAGGKVTVRVNGASVALTVGKELYFSASAAATAARS